VNRGLQSSFLFFLQSKLSQQPQEQSIHCFTKKNSQSTFITKSWHNIGEHIRFKFRQWCVNRIQTFTIPLGDESKRDDDQHTVISSAFKLNYHPDMIEPVPSSLSYEGPLHSTKRSYSCPVHCSTNIKLVKLKYDSGLNILRCLFLYTVNNNA